MSEDGQKTEAQALVDSVNGLSVLFDELCRERHEAGQKEYGQFTFLGNDVTRMMLEELADTANYCRMQAIKLMMLQDLLENELQEKGFVKDGQTEITLGVQAFKGTKDVGWGKS